MKKLLFFHALVLYFILISIPVCSATHNAREMDVGVWTENQRYMSFGSYNGRSLVWRVLEVKENDMDSGGVKTAFLLLDDLLRSLDGSVEAVGFGSSNNFPNSKIKEWLNDNTSGFMSCLSAYHPDILDTTYGPGNAPRRWLGGSTSDTSKVFLLSAEEADNKSYFANDADRTAANAKLFRE